MIGQTAWGYHFGILCFISARYWEHASTRQTDMVDWYFCWVLCFCSRTRPRRSGGWCSLSPLLFSALAPECLCSSPPPIVSGGPREGIPRRVRWQPTKTTPREQFIDDIIITNCDVTVLEHLCQVILNCWLLKTRSFPVVQDGASFARAWRLVDIKKLFLTIGYLMNSSNFKTPLFKSNLFCRSNFKTWTDILEIIENTLWALTEHVNSLILEIIENTLWDLTEHVKKLTVWLLRSSRILCELWRSMWTVSCQRWILHSILKPDSIKQRVKGGEEDNVSPTGLPQVWKPSGRNVVFFPSLHPLLDTITILSFKRNFETLNCLTGFNLFFFTVLVLFMSPTKMTTKPGSCGSIIFRRKHSQTPGNLFGFNVSTFIPRPFSKFGWDRKGGGGGGRRGELTCTLVHGQHNVNAIQKPSQPIQNSLIFTSTLNKLPLPFPLDFDRGMVGKGVLTSQMT